mmetsp:Transcript_10089/g.25228  ORF Transcript_10089/g.25228 Transcript_10089/m.25228 type:complete len:207 (+) Transcript_10089:77-697(+)
MVSRIPIVVTRMTKPLSTSARVLIPGSQNAHPREYGNAVQQPSTGKPVGNKMTVNAPPTQTRGNPLRVAPFMDDPFFSPFAALFRERPFDARALRSMRENPQMAVDVVDNESTIKFHAELPGVKKENINLSVHDDVLTISCKKEDIMEKDEGDYHIRERSFGSFSRSFTLPSNTDSSNVKATFSDGVLEVTIPKSSDKGVKRVAIE